jgi:hypothetical protein
MAHFAGGRPVDKTDGAYGVIGARRRVTDDITSARIDEIPPQQHYGGGTQNKPQPDGYQKCRRHAARLCRGAAQK